VNVVFENPGEIDVRAIRTFGVSAKENADAIGFFGTGLKYSIAILLREGMSIEIISGLERFVFQKKEVAMRGQTFEVITMNGEEMSFTTRLGVNWKIWQAFRELYCNCTDENGKAFLLEDVDEPEVGKTKIVVTGKAFVDCFIERQNIIFEAPGELRMMGDSDVEVYNKPSKSLFYKGVRVLDFEKPAMFTYNVKRKLDLTEDRTLLRQSQGMDLLPTLFAKSTDRSVLRRVLTASSDTQEGDFGFGGLLWSTHLIGDVFREVLSEEFKANNDKLNRSARELQRHLIKSAASKHYEEVEMTEVEEKQLKRATKIIMKVWKDFSQYQIMIVDTLGQDTYALADMNERIIVLSRKAFEQGTKFLTSTMIEEYMHLKTGFGDCTRSLQTHLFDSLCTLIENHIIKEPI
jgi:hypothetical protein